MSFFDRFQRSAWRLETRSFYQPDAEEFDRWQRGLTTTDGPRVRWVEQIAEATAAGRSIGRVLVVSLPLSPYWRWRLETAHEHAAAGEDIRIAVASDHVLVVPALVALQTDFWLLDDQRLLLLDYDRDGRFIGATATDDPIVVGVCREQRNLAVASSVPLQEFLLPA